MTTKEKLKAFSLEFCHNWVPFNDRVQALTDLDDSLREILKGYQLKPPVIPTEVVSGGSLEDKLDAGFRPIILPHIPDDNLDVKKFNKMIDECIAFVKKIISQREAVAVKLLRK